MTLIRRDRASGKSSSSSSPSFYDKTAFETTPSIDQPRKSFANPIL